MKTKLLTIFLIFFSSQAFSDWVFYTKDGIYKHYYDSEINKQGNYINIWYMISSPYKNNLGDQSAVQNIKIDCKSYRIKTLSYYTYAKAMGKENPRTEDKRQDKNWSNVPTRSIMNGVIRKVCTK